MKRIVMATLAAALVALSAPGRAETRVFEGTIPSNRGVVRLPLTLSTDLKDVVLWTDSYQAGAHFDPIVAIWRDGVRLGQNDDYMLLPGQTLFDSSLIFDRLEAGSYLLTITNFANFANGSLLSDGFRYDNPAAEAWELNNCTPGGDCPGNYWRLNLTDDMPLSQIPPPIPQVPEPATFALWLAGLALLAGRARSALGHARQMLRIARPLHLDV